MNNMKKAATYTFSSLLLLCSLTVPVHAQPGLVPPLPTPSGRLNAPIDLEGTWVSIVMEDWRWRMALPLIGDFANIPINAAARELGMSWRPEADAGNECRAYGAPGIMSEPGRIKISWTNDQELQLDFDAGRQSRTFYFGNSAPSAGAPSRQGYSLAKWEAPRGSGPVTFGLGLSPRGENVSRSLEVVTDNLIPGYLRKNGIPHSDQVTVTEYFDVIEISDGTTWMFVTIIVDDPVYLTEPWVTSMNFKKEVDDSKFNPLDCFVNYGE